MSTNGHEASLPQSKSHSYNVRTLRKAAPSTSIFNPFVMGSLSYPQSKINRYAIGEVRLLNIWLVLKLSSGEATADLSAIQEAPKIANQCYRSCKTKITKSKL